MSANADWVSYNMDWATMPANHAKNWAIFIVSSITNKMSMSANVHWISDSVDWETLPETDANNWASIIVNWVTKICLI
jgi:hypothetical protein